MKILLVQHSTDHPLVTPDGLQGHTVLTAATAAQAARLAEYHPDLNLAVFDLPSLQAEALPAASALRNNRHAQSLRVLFLADDDSLRGEIEQLGFSTTDYLPGPVDLAALQVRIDLLAELFSLRHKYEQQLYEQGRTFDIIFDQAPIGIAISYNQEPIADGWNERLELNPMFEKITGRSAGELSRLGWASITHPDDLLADLQQYELLYAGKINEYTMEKRIIRPDGSIVWVDMIVASLTSPETRELNHICLMQDITARKTMENALLESERSKSVLLSHLPGMAYQCLFDRDGTMLYISDGCYALTGYAPESFLHNHDLAFNDIITPPYREQLWNEWQRTIPQHLPYQCEYEITTAGGEAKWVLETGQGVYDAHGEVMTLEGIILDITDRKKLETDLRYISEHDPWTGLYTRPYLEAALNADANLTHTEKRAVVNINLSTIQSLTTVYGFHYTLNLIQKVVAALKNHCTSSCTLFQTYESRFTFYLKGYSGREELEAFCQAVAGTLSSILSIERIGGGIGVVQITPENQSDVDQLLKDLLITSEIAMQRQDIDFGICFYDETIQQKIIRQRQIRQELNKVAEDAAGDSFYLQYQPILNLQTNQICGFESLSRLRIEGLGIIPPLEFIPIAEETKQIIPIGETVISKALRFLAKLKQLGYDTVSISVNISVIQLLDSSFRSRLLRLTEEMRIAPQNIGLEITESQFASDHDELNVILGELMQTGFHIMIDDFGTGYSSLARERDLNIDCLKIDKSFIARLSTLKPEEAITADVISMAHRMGHCVIAEGVELEEQRQYLLESDCDRIQGYLISPPLDEDDAIAFLQNQSTCQ